MTFYITIEGEDHNGKFKRKVFDLDKHHVVSFGGITVDDGIERKRYRKRREVKK